MNSAIVAVALGQAQLISYETKATPAPQVLTAIEALTGRNIEWDGAFENEVLIISAHDVKPRDLLDKIARVLSAQWEERDSKLKLVPDAKRRNQQEKDRVSARVNALDQLLTRCSKELETNFEGSLPVQQGAINAAEHAARRVTPLSRYAMRLLIAIGAERLAPAERGTRLVFALNPNSAQRPFPKAAEGALQLFRKEWDLYMRKGEPSTNPDQLGTVRKARLEWRESINANWTFSSEAKLSHLWLSVRDPLGYPEDAIKIGIVDDKGNALGETLSLSTVTEVKERPRTEDQTPLTLEPETLQFASLLREPGQMGVPKLSSTAPLGAQILKPNFEPLTLGSELFLQAARHWKQNLVSLVNDNSLAFTLSSNTPTLGSFERTLEQIAVTEKADGWMLTTPNQPAEARRSRDSRRAIRRLLSDASDGHLDLLGLAEYIESRPYGSARGLGYRLAALFDPEVSPFMLRGSESAYHLFGSLTSAQRMRSEPFSISDLSPRSREALDKMALCEGLCEVQTAPTANGRPSFALGSHEPTYLFPQGLPSSGTFIVRSLARQTALRPILQGGNAYFEDIAPEAVASTLFFQENPQLIEGTRGSIVWPDRYQVVRGSFFVLKAEFKDSIVAAGLNERVISSPVMVDKLPKDILDAIQVERERLEKMKAAGNPPKMIRNSSGSKPPPRM